MARRFAARPFGIAFILVWTLLPLYWVLNTSLQTDAQISSKPANYIPPTPTIANFRTLLTGSGDAATAIRQSMVNICIECAAATVVTVVLATLAAYAFARMTFRGKNVVFYSVLATMALPAYATLIPLYRIMSTLGLVNTYTGIVLVYVSGFLPLARPGIVSTAIITFLSAWAQFLFPLVLSSDLSTQPLTVAIAALQGRHTVPYSLMSAAGVIAVSVPALIAVVLNRYIVNGLLAGSVK